MGYPHTVRAARSYEAQGPYNRYSSTSNVSADRYEGENEKDRNEKWDEKRDRKHGVSATLFNSRTDGKSLARTIATINEFHLLRFARSFNCSLCLYAIAHPRLSRDNKSFVVHFPLCCTI